jgi:hypothetical protein
MGDQDQQKLFWLWLRRLQEENISMPWFYLGYGIRTGFRIPSNC